MEYKCLFENYELQPEELAQIIEKYPTEPSYRDLGDMHTECLKIGYTFDWGLDAVAYDLRPIEGIKFYDRIHGKEIPYNSNGAHMLWMLKNPNGNHKIKGIVLLNIKYVLVGDVQMQCTEKEYRLLETVCSAFIEKDLLDLVIDNSDGTPRKTTTFYKANTPFVSDDTDSRTKIYGHDIATNEEADKYALNVYGVYSEILIFLDPVTNYRTNIGGINLTEKQKSFLGDVYKRHKGMTIAALYSVNTDIAFYEGFDIEKTEEDLIYIDEVMKPVQKYLENKQNEQMRLFDRELEKIKSPKKIRIVTDTGSTINLDVTPDLIFELQKYLKTI